MVRESYLAGLESGFGRFDLGPIQRCWSRQLYWERMALMSSEVSSSLSRSPGTDHHWKYKEWS